MKKLTNVFAVFILTASAFLVACGGSNRVAYDYDEHDQPCYEGQQPSYRDGDYYIFNCGDRYRRVRTERIIYVPNPIYIPIIQDTERETIYRTMPQTRRVDSGVTRSTGVGSTSVPTAGRPTGTSTGVTRSTSSGTSTSQPRSTSSTTSAPTRSTSAPSRSTSSSSSSSSSRSSSSSPTRSTSSRKP